MKMNRSKSIGISLILFGSISKCSKIHLNRYEYPDIFQWSLFRLLVLALIGINHVGPTEAQNLFISDIFKMHQIHLL